MYINFSSTFGEIPGDSQLLNPPTQSKGPIMHYKFLKVHIHLDLGTARHLKQLEPHLLGGSHLHGVLAMSAASTSVQLQFSTLKRLPMIKLTIFSVICTDVWVYNSSSGDELSDLKSPVKEESASEMTGYDK